MVSEPRLAEALRRKPPKSLKSPSRSGHSDISLSACPHYQTDDSRTDQDFQRPYHCDFNENKSNLSTNYLLYARLCSKYFMCILSPPNIPKG